MSHSLISPFTLILENMQEAFPEAGTPKTHIVTTS